MNRFGGPRVALPAAFLILIVITAVIGQRLAVQSRTSLSCIVEDKGTGGASGIQSWAGRMGFSTLPLRAPIREVAIELPSTGNCLITAGNGSWNPFGEDFTEADWTDISRWIRKGNTLIVMTTDSHALPSQIEEQFTEQNAKRKPSIDWNQRKPFESRPVEQTLVPTFWGGQMSVDAAGPRLKDLPQELRLAGREDASVLAGKALDQGMIYLLLDESAWSNEGFDRSDNAATLARILKQKLGPSGALAFDEYRHGYGRVESFTTLFLALPGAKSFAWMALAWGLFWLWSSTRRMCPPDEFQEVERRTALEYIESVAAMNQRARAAPLAVRSVLQRVRYLLKKRGIVDESVNETLRRAEANVAAGERPAKPTQEIELVSELIKLRRELYGTRRSP